MNNKYSISLLLSLLVITSASLAMEPPPHGMKREELPPSPDDPKNAKTKPVKAALLPTGHKREDLPPYQQPNTHLSQGKTSFDAQSARIDDPDE